MWLLLLFSCRTDHSDYPGYGPPLDFGESWDLTLLDEQETSYLRAVSGDVDQDGALDLVVGGKYDLEIFYGPFDSLSTAPDHASEGAFSGLGNGPLVVDVNLDGAAEVVGSHISSKNSYGGDVAVHWLGSGELSQWSSTGGSGHSGAYLGWEMESLGDPDGDGVVDLLISAYWGPAFVVPGDAPSGDIRDVASSTVEVVEPWSWGGDTASADLDGDGILDLVVGDRIYLGPFVEDRVAADADGATELLGPVLVSHPAGSGLPELWGVNNSYDVLRIEDPLNDAHVLATWHTGSDLFDASRLDSLGDVNRDGWLELELSDTLDGDDSYVRILPADEGARNIGVDALLELPSAENAVLVELDTGGAGLFVLGWNESDDTPDSWWLYEVD